MKRKPLRTLIHLLPAALLLLPASCGEELMTTDVDVATPIVESYLEEGKNTLSVKLYSMEVYLGEDFVLSKPLSGLTLLVNDKVLEETSTAGSYALDLGSDTIRGLQEYTLAFEYQGTTVKATTRVPQPVTRLSIEPGYITQTYSYYWSDADTTAITLSWDDPDRSYYQVYIVSPSTSTVNTPNGAVFGRRMMQPFQGSSHVMSARDFPTTGYYSIYLYRVNKDYAELYERISSTDLANPVSFIDNALGIFTSMSVARIGFSVVESTD
ncbi:MAG: DUF4249 domain-containing protein [Tannerellaceae bacterium]|jgi:hypothetical protein|nr:DUF4249 domain-containing protein [Tannerellaceae bacterium]